jgi:putative transposase
VTRLFYPTRHSEQALLAFTEAVGHYHNAVMERFFWSLKHEWTNHETYANLEEARLSVFRYIQIYYNSVHLHRTLDYLSPNDYEAEHAQAQAA